MASLLFLFPTVTNSVFPHLSVAHRYTIESFIRA